jgi:hypothetical protein
MVWISYLKTIARYRKEGRCVIYTDEVIIRWGEFVHGLN